MHVPVLLNEILELLNPRSGENFVDGTANGGGHTMAISRLVGEEGRVLAIDKDSSLVNGLKSKIQITNVKNVVPVCGSYGDIKKIVQENNVSDISGMLLDLGYSSYHLEQSGRGFSFQKDEPLIMRYEAETNLGNGRTAQDVINQMREEELADIFYKYGEERFSRRIAKKIVEQRRIRRITSTKELADLVASVYPKRFFYKIHPATKVFQALRIFVNQELEELERFLPQALEILKCHGKLAIISFHSLEDRIVKNFFRDKAKDGLVKILTKKPIQASRAEEIENPRARSAKLRVVQVI